MTDNNSLLQPGETLGPAAAPAQPDSTHPLLQPGETLGDPVPSGHPIGDVIGKVSDVAGGVATGFAKGAGQTVSGISHILNKIPVVGETLAPSAGMKAFDPMTETHGTAEAVGSGLEGLAEFAAGDEALSVGQEIPSPFILNNNHQVIVSLPTETYRCLMRYHKSSESIESYTSNILIKLIDKRKKSEVYLGLFEESSCGNF